MVEPIEHYTLRSRVVQRLFHAILSGEFFPGEKLVEWKLAKDLNVAQSTVREALLYLECQRLVTRKGKSGTFVTKLTYSDLREIYDVRIQLEPFAASLASQRIKPGDFVQLNRFLEEMRAAGDQRDFVKISQFDALFHKLIWKLSGNQLLERLLELVFQPLWAFELIRLYSAPTYDFAKALQEHKELVEVLKKGSPKEVKAAFREMLEVFCAQDVENLRALDALKRGSSADEDSMNRARAAR